ncbi:MAG: hypothetical protein HY900_01975 [Deltaproteobacteria bacterium]|nr:hypothetical protein [Deltaproteobacteria bacterium]
MEIEVGSSFGHTLSRLAAHNTATLFFGIEINAQRHEEAARRAVRLSLPNLHFIQADAVEIVTKHLPACSVSVFHIYFPSESYIDPKGNRRPLMTRDFGNGLYRTLRKGGILRVLTDSKHYFDNVRRMLAGLPFWPFRCKPLSLALPPGVVAGTPLEYRYRQDGQIYSLHLVK